MVERKEGPRILGKIASLFVAPIDTHITQGDDSKSIPQYKVSTVAQKENVANERMVIEIRKSVQDKCQTLAKFLQAVEKMQKRIPDEAMCYAAISAVGDAFNVDVLLRELVSAEQVVSRESKCFEEAVAVKRGRIDEKEKEITAVDIEIEQLRSKIATLEEIKKEKTLSAKVDTEKLEESQTSFIEATKVVLFEIQTTKDKIEKYFAKGENV